VRPTVASPAPTRSRLALRVRSEGAAGTLDRAVTTVLDIVQVASRAIRTDHARAGPDETRVLVIDQLANQFPRRLQLAGEAGDLGGVQVGPDVLDAGRALRLAFRLGRPSVERPDVFLAPEPPFRAVRPRLEIDALRVALGRLVYH